MEAILAAVGALTQLYAKWLLAKAERGEKTAEAEAKWRAATDLDMAKGHWIVEDDPS
jgi:hypothetical protein